MKTEGPSNKTGAREAHDLLTCSTDRVFTVGAALNGTEHSFLIVLQDPISLQGFEHYHRQAL